jgi:hypothetical protein
VWVSLPLTVDAGVLCLPLLAVLPPSSASRKLLFTYVALLGAKKIMATVNIQNL